MSEFVDFIGLNNVVEKELVTGSLTISGNLSKSALSTGEFLHAYLLNLNGPYENPSYDYTKLGENRQARWLRENNELAVEKPIEEIQVETEDETRTVKERFGDGNDLFKEPAIYSPDSYIKHVLREKNSEELVRFKYPFVGDLEYFANRELNDRKDLKRRDLSRTKYDRIYSMYTEESTNYNFEQLIYKTRIFPHPRNTAVKENRKREQFTFPNFENERPDRNVSDAKNSFDQDITSQSKWPLDGRQNFRSRKPYNGDLEHAMSESAGELQSGYSKYSEGEIPKRLGMPIDYTAFYYADENGHAGTAFNAVGQTNSTIMSTASVSQSKNPLTSSFELSFQARFKLDAPVPDDYKDSGQPYQDTNDDIMTFGVADVHDNFKFFVTKSNGSQDYRPGFATGDMWGTPGIWVSDQNVNAGEWSTVYWEYDGSDSTNDPTILVNDKSTNLTEKQSPATKQNRPAEMTSSWVGRCVRPPGADNFVGSDGGEGKGGDVFNGIMGNILLATGSLSSNSTTLYNNGEHFSDYQDLTSSVSIDDQVISFWGMGDDPRDDTSKIYNQKVGTLDSAFNNNTGSVPISDGQFDLAVTWSTFQEGYNTIAERNEFVNSDSNSDYVTGAVDFSERVSASQNYIDRSPFYDTGSDPNNWIDDVYFAGDSEWFPSSSKQPFYRNYDKYNENLRFLDGQSSKTILPEFRISEHIEDYLSEEKGNFLAEKEDVFTITGSKNSSSMSDTFFEDYSFSDVAINFEEIKKDHSLSSVAEIKLECNANKKFLPYEGFLPSERSYQIGELFSKSYGPSIQKSGSHSHFQTIVKPFFAPGLFYNTIKSGIAVDYPVYTPNSNDIVTRTPDFVRPSRTDREAAYTASYPAIDMKYPVSGSNTGDWNRKYDKRLSFESLLSPESVFEGSYIRDTELNPYSVRDSVVSLGSPSSKSYKLGIHNFLASSYDFFIKNSTPTSFVSSPENEIDIEFTGFGTSVDQTSGVNIKEEEVGKVFAMDVVLKNSDVTNLCDVVNASDKGKVFEHHINKHTETFFPHESFGKPIVQNNYDEDGVGAYVNNFYVNSLQEKEKGATFASYTPCYYDGYARARITFEPDESGLYSYEEVQEKSKVTQFRALENTDFNRVYRPDFAPTDYKYGGVTLSNRNRTNTGLSEEQFNQVQSSVNLFGRFSSQREGDRWVIQPKFETPILNYMDVNAPKTSLANQLNSEGVWLNSGSVPREDEGIEFSLKDVPEEERKELDGCHDYSFVEEKEHEIFFDSQPADGDLIHVGIDDNTGSDEFYDLRTGATFEFDSDGSISDSNHVSVKIGSSLSDTVDILISQIRETFSDLFFNSITNIEKKQNAGIVISHFTSAQPSGFLVGLSEFDVYGTAPFSVTESNAELKEVASLKDKLGFQETTQKIGEVKDEKVVKEGVVAVPYQRINGDKKLFGVDTEEPTEFVADMLDKMEDYVFPPRMDFLNNPEEVDPFAMYIFEFEYKFDQDDLYDIWQGILPESHVEKESVSISHPVGDESFISEFDEDVQWFVFKVKQKGEWNYYDKTGLDEVGRGNSARDVQDLISEIPKYSYNWPYDYFTFVELADIDVEINMTFDEDLLETAKNAADAVESANQEILQDNQELDRQQQEQEEEQNLSEEASRAAQAAQDRVDFPLP